jgi:hypothetical protein
VKKVVIKQVIRQEIHGDVFFHVESLFVELGTELPHNLPEPVDIGRQVGKFLREAEWTVELLHRRHEALAKNNHFGYLVAFRAGIIAPVGEHS